jgi:two-component system, chemotaxis family, protein-glutamate methylesterase/glutaminase
MQGWPISKLSKRRQRLNPEGIKRDIIVIGASAGGVTALKELFASLPPDLPAAIGVVLHRSSSPSGLADVLGRDSDLPVIEPANHSPLKQSTIYLAPPDQHLLFNGDGVIIQRGPKEHSTRPAIDPLFRSAAEKYGERVLGVQLTGCGEDGVSGLLHINAAAGLAIAQDPAEAYMPYMPMNALRFDDVQGIFPLRDIGSVIVALARGNEV